MSQYNSLPISQFPPGANVLPTDEYLATDVTQTAPTHPSGYTNRYTVNQLQAYLETQFGGSNLFSVLAASTTNLSVFYDNGLAGIGATITNTGTLEAITIDGVALNVGDRWLYKDSTTQAYNGIYVVTIIGDVSTPWVCTRSSDYDGLTSTQIEQGGFVVVVKGLVNELTTWIETAPGPFVVGTSPIVFEEQVVLSAVTDGTNLGSGDGLFTSVAATVMQFKSLIAGSNVNFSVSGTDITINSTNPGGTITGATNLGGDGLYTSASGPNLQFKGLVAGSNVTLTPGADTITINSSNPGGTITGGNSLGGMYPIYGGVTGSTMEFVGLTAGTNISLTTDGTQIFIDSTSGSGFDWENVTMDTQAASAGFGYVCSYAGVTNINLPATCAIGDLIGVMGSGSGQWTVNANTGQTIVYDSTTSSSSGGSVSSNDANDSTMFMCTVADTQWTIFSPKSNLLTFA